MANNAMMRAGLPPEAWAPFMATVSTESGWNMKPPDGRAGEIGPAQVLPSTGKQLGYTPDQLRDPQTNLLAGAQYFGQKWKEANGNPMGAWAGYNTGDVTNPDPAYVSKAGDYLDGWSAPGGGPTTPQQAMALSNQMMDQANQLEAQQNRVKLMQGMGVPMMMPPGDPAAIRTQLPSTVRWRWPARPSTPSLPTRSLTAARAIRSSELSWSGGPRSLSRPTIRRRSRKNTRTSVEPALTRNSVARPGSLPMRRWAQRPRQTNGRRFLEPPGSCLQFLAQEGPHSHLPRLGYLSPQTRHRWLQRPM
jgi:hypothetical protein